MTTEIATRQGPKAPALATESATILQVIQRAAADPQCDIEKMERLMAMHERMQSRNAEAEFNTAMALMQDELPSIAERGKAHGGQKYATLEDINDIAKPIMKRHGFAVSFRVKNIQGGIEVTGVLMHKAGHREETTMTLPLDASGSKNAVQSVGSSTSYGKRYVMSALLNITTRGEDDDGYAAVPDASVTESQAKQLKNLFDQCKAETKNGFTGLYGELSLVRKKDFDRALMQLTKAVARDSREASNADNP